MVPPVYVCVLLWLQPERLNGTQELFIVYFITVARVCHWFRPGSSGEAGFRGRHGPCGHHKWMFEPCLPQADLGRAFLMVQQPVSQS